jgi:tRNA-splicing ligase RtcB
MPEVKSLYLSARHQLGTLGGGNHFIELQKDKDNHLWIMIHSGSRHFGKEIADRYAYKAKRLCEMFYADTIPGLEFLPIQVQEAKDYWNAMNYCVAFAFANRQLMMNQICEIIQKRVPDAIFEPMINIAHNYAAWEHHFNSDVIVHRKGATRARKGEIGIIPGSMGTCSYIVEGLGNPDSFESCSHGAGRQMGRKAARFNLDLKEQQRIMDSQNIVHFMKQQDQLDEAPGAYKNIKTVMNNQADLVRPLHQLWPIMVLKG